MGYWLWVMGYWLWVIEVLIGLIGCGRTRGYAPTVGGWSNWFLGGLFLGGWGLGLGELIGPIGLMGLMGLMGLIGPMGLISWAGWGLVELVGLDVLENLDNLENLEVLELIGLIGCGRTRGYAPTVGGGSNWFFLGGGFSWGLGVHGGTPLRVGVILFHISCCGASRRGSPC